MDDIVNTWNDLNNDFNNKEVEQVTQKGVDNEKSGLLLERLSRNLRLGLYWNIFFLVGLTILAIFHSKQPHILLLIAISFSLLLGNLIYCGAFYKRVRREPILTYNAKEMLINYYKRVASILRFERVWSLFAIPFSLILGVLYTHLRKFGSFEQIIFEPKTLIATGVLMVTAVPLVILWVSWSQKIAFKKDLIELKDSIKSLEN